MGGGGLLFGFAFSVVLWGERGAADKHHWPVWGALAVFRPHWVCPAHGLCACPSTLLRLQVALQGVAGPDLCALPRPKPLRFQFSGTPQRCRLGWACVLCLPHRATQATRSLTRALSPGAVSLLPSAVLASVSRHTGRVHLVSLLGSWFLAMALLVDVNHPESLEVFG